MARVERAVANEGEIELRGILASVSNRFYRNGWGYGSLTTEAGDRVKITGTLEGHVEGTSIIVRGVYRDSNYGRQLECSSIVVDQVSGELTVIRAWARKHLKAHEKAVLEAVRLERPVDRWRLLSKVDFLEEQGLTLEVAELVAARAAAYLALVAAKRGIMERGFADGEADALCDRYGADVLQVLDAQPFWVAIERVLSFSRVDAVVGERVPRTHPERLQAALVQALSHASREGHTAMPRVAAIRDAAEIAGVYDSAYARLMLPYTVVAFGALLQLRSTARAERTIADWVLRALVKEGVYAVDD